METNPQPASNDPTKNPATPGNRQIKETNWEQVQRLFEEACELTLEARGEFLDFQCADNSELRAQVEQLLNSDAAAGQFMGGKGESQTNYSGSGESLYGLPGMKAPVQLGRYRLLAVIGEGGFGRVYRAEQVEPIRRFVAVKILKTGMDTQAVIARFEAERQALAMMDHQNIARVIDAGETESGRPYFVMELVNGIPITEYCDTHRFTARERIELFIPICHAVQHAHQKGIIHRDLKPSNVLVMLQADHPVPKVIDFGIAKATQGRLTDRTLFTELRQMIGTPLYMSPEQADLGGIDIDTRSDIYSLGVMLYELLTGTTPIDAAKMRQQVFAEMQRWIFEVDPPLPSARVSSLGQSESDIALQRRTVFRQLQNTLRGDLDWVVMKCLEKNRNRRYDTAAGLAADLSRYLLDEPVSAARPSKIYQARKYFRRHRIGVTAISVVALSLIFGAVASAVGFVRANSERSIAQAQRNEAERQRLEARSQQKKAENQALITRSVDQFVRQMLTSASPRKSLGERVTVLQAVAAAVTALDQGSLADQPLVQAAVRDTLGETFEGLGQYDLAEHQFQIAMDLDRKNLAAPDDPDLLLVMNDLGSIYAAEGKLGEAEKILRLTLETEQKRMSGDDRDLIATMTNLGLVVEQQGNIKEAEEIFGQALTLKRAETKPGDPTIAQQINNLADCYSNEGNLTAAEPLLREALAVQRAGLPPGTPDIAIVLDNLATLLDREGHAGEAEPLHREALAISRKALPAGDPDIASHLYSLARTLETEGKYSEADPFYVEAIAICRGAWPDGNTHVALILDARATMLLKQNKPADAESLAKEAVTIYRKFLPPTSADITKAQQILAEALRAQHKKSD